MRALSHPSRIALDDEWCSELAEFIAIPSISADRSHREDVLRAAYWLEGLVRRAGGEARVIPIGGSHLLIGAIAADTEPATSARVLIYGHFDVQPPEPLERWDSPPFSLEERDDWLYGRGIADDKGQLFALIKAAQELKTARVLPVNLRIIADGEEEVGGHSVVDFLAPDEERIDACVIFDSSRKRAEQPEFSLGCRGIIGLHLAVHTGEHDLHSGMYGGVALNAAHALMQTLVSTLAVDGLLAEELRAGCIPLTDRELQAVEVLPAGSAMLERVGVAPLDPAAATTFHERTWAEPSLDVNGIHSGKPEFLNTTLPVEAHARLTIRLAPGQDVSEIAAKAEQLLREGLPVGARMTIERENLTPPGLIPSTSKALQLAADAFERTLGTRPLFVRLGGTLPILSALAARQIPTVLSGFSLPESAAHAPNERMRRVDLEQAVSTAAELYTAWSGLR